MATGSVDASIKILDVDRMLAKSAPDENDSGQQQGHPVIRTLYDHTGEIQMRSEMNLLYYFQIYS